MKLAQLSHLNSSEFNPKDAVSWVDHLMWDVTLLRACEGQKWVLASSFQFFPLPCPSSLCPPVCLFFCHVFVWVWKVYPAFGGGAVELNWTRSKESTVLFTFNSSKMKHCPILIWIHILSPHSNRYGLKPHYLTLIDSSLCTKAVVNPVSINLNAVHLLIFSKSDSLTNSPKSTSFVVSTLIKLKFAFWLRC